MRLLVDGLFLRPGRIGGLEHMFSSLLAALTAARADDDRVRVLLPAGVDLGARSFADDVEAIPIASPANRFLAVERRLPVGDDVALFPNYYTPLAAARRGLPSVTVVHDLQFRAFPENFTSAKKAFQHVALRATCRLATRVVAISEFTATELAAFQPVVRDRLDVVANPIDWSRFDEATAPAEPVGDDGAPLFVLAAAQYRHKNIATVLEAFSRVHAREPRARLVLVGQVPELLGEARVGAVLPTVAGVVQLGYVSDAVLSWLYRRATAVLLPSLYEGCGLPCAEAIGLGTPVVHSGCGALPEVAAGAGVQVDDPTAAGAWAEELGRAVEGGLDRPAPGTVAAARAAHDPGDIGARYWDVLRRALGTAG